MVVVGHKIMNVLHGKFAKITSAQCTMQADAKLEASKAAKLMWRTLLRL